MKAARGFGKWRGKYSVQLLPCTEIDLMTFQLMLKKAPILSFVNLTLMYFGLLIEVTHLYYELCPYFPMTNLLIDMQIYFDLAFVSR